MAQVEDVAGSTGGLMQDSPGFPLDLGDGRQQDNGIEVSLDGDPRTQSVPGPGEVDPPVKANHRPAGVALKFQQRARVSAEMDRRNRGVELTEEASHMRLYKALVVGGAQGSNPAIEKLDRVCTGGNLSVQIEGRCVDQLAHQSIPGTRVAIHEGFWRSRNGEMRRPRWRSRPG